LRVIDVEQHPYEAQERKVIAVPATFLDGRLAFVGAPLRSEFESVLKGKRGGLGSKMDMGMMSDAAMDALGKISTTAFRFYLYGDFEAIFSNKELAARLMKLGDWKEVDEEKLRQAIKAKYASYLDEKADVFLDKIASEFVREIYWLYDEFPSRDKIDQLYPPPVFGHWLMTRASMGGRIGQSVRRLNNRALMGRIDRARDFMLRNYVALCSRVAEQQRTIGS
jgi:predicted thioredoxin/glutaredoxin